jgi:hypothetical protein
MHFDADFSPSRNASFVPENVSFLPSFSGMASELFSNRLRIVPVKSLSGFGSRSCRTA